MSYHEPWNIHSRAHRCAHTQEPFRDGDLIVTAIFPSDATPLYTRLDFSESGWAARPTHSPEPYSQWRSRYHAPISTHKQQVEWQQESAEERLARLVAENQPETENLRYVLALTLERKKILREISTQTLPNGILRLYQHVKTQETIPILDPNLTLNQLVQLQREIISLLP